jgi:membrane protease YdiL (CAAX protease family)
VWVNKSFSPRRLFVHATPLLLLWVGYFLFGFVDGLYTDSLYYFSPLAFWAHDALARFVVPLMLLALVAWKMRLQPRDFGVEPERLRQAGTWGWVLIAIAGAAVIEYELSGWIWRNWPLLYDVQPFFSDEQTGALRVGLAVYVAMRAAVVEELFFRAMPKALFAPQPWLPKQMYYIVGSLGFGATHARHGLVAVIVASVLGLFFSWLYDRSGNLWPNITAHWAVDFLPLMA